MLSIPSGLLKPESRTGCQALEAPSAACWCVRVSRKLASVVALAADAVDYYFGVGDIVFSAQAARVGEGGGDGGFLQAFYRAAFIADEMGVGVGLLCGFAG